MSLMTFGAAIDVLKEGGRVTRTAWVADLGHDGIPSLVLIPGSQFTVEAERPLGRGAPELIGHTVEYQPHIDLITPDRTLAPWTPVHADLLAGDWVRVD